MMNAQRWAWLQKVIGELAEMERPTWVTRDIDFATCMLDDYIEGLNMEGYQCDSLPEEITPESAMAILTTYYHIVVVSVLATLYGKEVSIP